MFGWALPVTASARDTLPNKFAAFRFPIADPLADTIVGTCRTPLMVRSVKVPTDVMFGWAFSVTDRATSKIPTVFAS